MSHFVLGGITLLLSSLACKTATDILEITAEAPASTPAAVVTIPITVPPSKAPEATTITPGNAANLQQVAQWGEDSSVMDLSWSPDGEMLAAATSSGISLHDPQSLVLIRAIDSGEQVTAVDFSPDGSILATGSYEGNLIVWDAANGVKLLTLAENLAAMSLDFSPDGTQLLSGGWYTGDGDTAIGEGTVKLWDASSGQEIGSLGEYTKGISSAAFSPAGNLIAWGGEFYESVGLWDQSSGSKLEPIYTGPGVTSLAFSPVDNILAVGLGDGSVQVWDVSAMNLRQTLQVHQDWVYINRVAFSTDGNILVSGSADGSVKLWNVMDGIELAALNNHSDEIWGLAFSTDGRLLATASQDGALRLWSVAP